MARSSGRRRPLIIVGVLVIVVGLVAGIALWVGSVSRRNEAVADLARAPVGCDTTLDFAERGEYLVYVETVGRLDDVRGDCDAVGEYDTRSVRPDVEIAVVDPDGDAVDLAPVGSEVEYDVDGYVGRSEFRVEIAEAADHVIRVESTDDVVFAVAIGRDPSDGVAALRIGGVVAAVAGIVFGLGLIVAGSRRRTPASASAPSWPPAPPWQAGAGIVSGQPPVGPPLYRQPQGPPPSHAPAPPQAPPPPPTGGNQQWQPPPPPRPPAPNPPRIPGQPDLAPPPPVDVDDATTQDRPHRADGDDHRRMPPPG